MRKSCAACRPNHQVCRTGRAPAFAIQLKSRVYSLKPPPNPNRLSGDAKEGQVIFAQQGCAACHPAPLCTNNKPTPARGFTVPVALRRTEAIPDVCVGTDPGLALERRRGTGFYKVPSLRGAWMRSVFGHEGQEASLEEWFDPARLRPDYVANGFHKDRRRAH